MCEAGGCFCRVKPGVGPRWDCVIDTTCLPDCSPADESCGAQADGGEGGLTPDDGGEGGLTPDGGAEAEAAPPTEAGE